MPIVRILGGAFDREPEELQGSLSRDAERLVRDALADVEPGSLRDYHAHMVGIGTNGSGASVNPKKLSWRHPKDRLATLVYLSGAGITDEREADRQYVERLVRLIRTVEGHGKLGILAFDRHYNADGTVNPEKTEFFTPNDYVLGLAEAYPDAFFPIVSVHPYREDALAELHRCADRGARYMKWLPNAQGMDASDPKVEPYYAALIERGMVLLTHVGEEKAVEAEEDQALGNPLLFREALDMGVTIIMAHAASLGDNADLDRPGMRAENFDLLLRLFDEPRYEGRLYADISATTQFNRLSRPLVDLLARDDLHGRLVNGSDYPLPALNIMIQTHALVRAGLLAPEDRAPLKEIYDVNPLLFDYVVKRRLRHPESRQRFPASLFTAHPDLPPT